MAHLVLKSWRISKGNRFCRCPGVYSGQGCGATLKCVQFREGGGCWGCSSWPACDYKEAATERLANPQVTLEAVSKDLFKVNVHTHHQSAPPKQTEQSNDDGMPVSAYIQFTLCFHQSTALPPAALLFHASCLQTKVLVGVRYH